MSKIVAIVGSYRKGGTTDAAVQAVLEGARARGAETTTLYLTEQHIEFCTNCRQCTETVGVEAGRCVLQDDLDGMLSEIHTADAIVLSSPVQCYNVSALFRRFMERLVGAAYWPAGKDRPVMRNKHLRGKAVVVASAAMPGLMIPLMTGTAKALRLTAIMLGFKPVASLWVGLAGRRPQQPLSARVIKRANAIGAHLV